MRLLERLYEAPGLRPHDLTSVLAELYDGGLGFETPRVIANFVSSIDGVVALDSADTSPSVISGPSDADRFIMGLLRACAGAVLVGAGTLRAEPQHQWTPDFVYPQGSDEFAALRRQLGLPPEPELVVLTAGGRLDPEIPALRKALILTSESGARRLERTGYPHQNLRVIGGDSTLRPSRVLDAISSRGHKLILSEGGPTVLGQLIEDGLLDELFLTISPFLFGRNSSDNRLALIEGVDLFKGGASPARILTVHKHESHLFVRYLLSRSASREGE